ncbi:hypothetical protein VYE96_04285 [Fusobacterium pseudoperiodonticum]|nr:hypothetical protein [Fusobacterium pseudoperiodonticum]
MRIWYKCDGGESRKNILDDARLNPKHYGNRQSATKPEKESSTTIPREGVQYKRLVLEVVSPKVLRYTMDKI